MTNFDKIEKYHSGEMSEGEKLAFEKDLESNSELKAEMDYFRMAKSVIESDIENDLRNQLKQMGKKGKTDGGRIVPFRRNFLAIAAGLAALLAAWFLFLQPPLEDQIFAQFFEVPSDLITKEIGLELTESGLGGDEEILKKLKEGMQLYAQKDYEKAIPILEEVSKVDEFYRQDDAIFYCGAAQLAIDQPGKAISNFSNLVNRLDFNKKEEALWFMALAYVKQKDFGKAKSVLVALPKNAQFGARRDKLLAEIAKAQK